MMYKRPLECDESYEIPSKHPRQLECVKQLASFVEIHPCNAAHHKSYTSVDEGEEDFNKSQGEDTVLSGDITDLAIGAFEGFETNALGSISSLSRVAGSTSAEDSKVEATDNLSFLHGVFEPALLTRTLFRDHEIYSSVFDLPPRKVGPDHQADVPAWGLSGIKITSNQMVDDYNTKQLMGTCIIPMADSEASDHNDNKVGNGTADCSCKDKGSVRCVRQHIVEAREKLRGTLGEEQFMELGFCDMGEEVARKWSEEEEEAFHEVVFSNPASSGRNFWNHLSVAFPSRTKKEIISYYFNVFMLRRRAEQNRLDSLNIDSDNDEWQDSDDGDYECGTTEEDEDDSVVESLDDQDNSGYDNNDDGNVVDEGGAHSRKSLNGCSFDSEFDLFGSNPQKYGEDHDIQDDSCTSYECQPSKANSCSPVVVVAATHECRVEFDHDKRLQGSYNGLINGHEMEPCDDKVWDVGYHFMGPKTDDDLFSTCNMIKEVFGEEAFNNKGRDGKDIN